MTPGFDELMTMILNEGETLCRHLLLEADLRGEWWIDNHGQAIFADGDVGDMNHEGYIIETLTMELLEHFDVYVGDINGNLSDYEEEIKHALKLDEAQSEEYDRDPADYIIKILENDNTYPTPQQASDAVLTAWGASRDAREYGMRYWGYKRMKDENIQTHTLTTDDLKIISRGIDSAYSDDLYGHDGESEEPTFNIEVNTTRKYYRDIPLSVIDEGDLATVMGF